MTAKLSRQTQEAVDALQPGADMTTPAEWFDAPNKPPANVTPETIAAASAPLTSSAQSAWFQLARKIDESEATYRHLAERCLKSWDYPSALRWRAIADGLNLARSHMEEIAAEARRGAGLGCLPHTVGSATEAPPAGTIPVP